MPQTITAKTELQKTILDLYNREKTPTYTYSPEEVKKLVEACQSSTCKALKELTLDITNGENDIAKVGEDNTNNIET